MQNECSIFLYYKLHKAQMEHKVLPIFYNFCNFVPVNMILACSLMQVMIKWDIDGKSQHYKSFDKKRIRLFY
jgi:hypothetical protein